MSPLLAAVESNDICLFMLCKDHHANLNARNKDGKTALIIAAERGNEDLVSLLLTEGEQVIEVEAQDVSNYYQCKCRLFLFLLDI